MSRRNGRRPDNAPRPVRAPLPPASRTYFDALAGTPRYCREIADHEPSAWLRRQFEAITSGLIAGTTSVCEHLPALLLADPYTPRVACLWRADMVTCPACSGDAFRLDGDAEWTCDRCGTVDREHCAPIVLGSGNGWLIHAGLCRACSAREYGALA